MLRLFSNALRSDSLVAAISTLVFATRVVQAQGVDVGDFVTNGGTVAVGVLLGLYVFIHLIEKVWPMLKGEKVTTKPTPWGAGGPLDTQRFRVDVISQTAKLDLISQQVADMHKWHAVLGPDGAPIWYGNTHVMMKLAEILDRMERQVCDIQRDVEELRRHSPEHLPKN